MEKAKVEEVKAKEYKFRHRVCDCGLNLSDKVSVVTSLHRSARLMGTCPGCGKQMLLNAPLVDPAIPAPAKAPVKSISKK